ncbi:uncharacterized protein LOC114530999 [Dendronephthya gigantea]|uniref:uncharacterized protein LOC114530999 n=1 Tax=Dendronephthya gigantea TaxID=151771 RepID=UPI00106CFD11|nr:uncharacterized protein LOC114530999 [Dendronephthya gigantea]
MTNAILKITILFAFVLVARAENAKGSEFYQRFMTKRAAPAPAGGKGKQNFVFQSPNGLARGNGYGGFGYGGVGPWGYGHGYGNLGHIHPVPVTGVKALSVAYDPVSGVPYVCDPNKKADAAKGGAATPAPAAPATGKRSEVEKDEEKKDEIKVKIPDYPPCPDPKKSFPWSCILGDKSSKREECARAKKAVKDATKRYWPAMAGFYPPYFGGYGYPGFGGYGAPFVVPLGYGGYGRFLG